MVEDSELVKLAFQLWSGSAVIGQSGSVEGSFVGAMRNLFLKGLSTTGCHCIDQQFHRGLNMVWLN